MWAKIFSRLACCLVIVVSANNCRRDTAEHQENTTPMPKPTIEQVQEKHQDHWMAIPGVVGVGIGAVDNKPVIKVLVVQQTPALAQKIPKMVEGYSVVIEETGEIRALKRDSG